MVNIRRAYEVFALGLFCFSSSSPTCASPRVAGVALSRSHAARRRGHGSDDPDDLPQPRLGPGDHFNHHDARPGLVNWICPFGILHHFFGWIGNRRNTKQMIEVNRYRKIYALKYYILAAMIAMASLWLIPTAIEAPGEIWQAYRGAELKQTGLNGLSRRLGPESPRSRREQARQQLAANRPSGPDRADGSFDDHQHSAHG